MKKIRRGFETICDLDRLPVVIEIINDMGFTDCKLEKEGGSLNQVKVVFGVDIEVDNSHCEPEEAVLERFVVWLETREAIRFPVLDDYLAELYEEDK